MNKIIKAENLPENEEVYLKKDIFGWRVVYPLRRDDGYTHWRNLLFGGTGNILRTAIMIGIILILIFSYSHDIQEVKDFYGEIANNPIQYCRNYVRQNNIPEINVTNWNLTMEVNKN